MFNEYENIVIAAIALLKQLRIKVNNFTVNETLQNHSDFPSLLSISDALNKWNVANGAASISPADIEQLPVPFVAYIRDKEHPFVVVNKVSDDEVLVFSDSYKRTRTFKREDFLKKWDGVYLLAEAGETSGEQDYQRNKLNHISRRLIPTFAITLIVSLSFLFFQQNLAGNARTAYIQYFILLAGVILSILLLWFEIDKNNPFLNKVCTGITKGSCKGILTSKASKVFTWLSWSEVGFFYFAGSFLCVIADPGNPFPYIFNLLALPYIGFSLYYQGVLAKTWCFLCLNIQGLLLLGGVNVIVNGLWRIYSSISVQTVSTAFVLYALPVLAWYSIKGHVLKLQTGKQTRREYFRLKFDAENFNTLLQRQKRVKLPAIAKFGIDLGNPHAAYTIIKVCNPYCGPCAKAHPEIERLIEENPNLKAKIVFAATADEADFRYKPVKHLLAIAANNNEKVTKQALDDWYLPVKKDYDVFARKYPVNGEMAHQDSNIAAMEKWCNENGIQATPTIFISNPYAMGAGQPFYELPDVYSISDINHFFLDDPVSEETELPDLQPQGH